MKKFVAVLTAVVCLSVGAAGMANATSVLYSDSGGTLGYGVGYSSWTSFTNALRTATGNQLTGTPNLNNYSQMLGYDALFVDQRWTSGALSTGEMSNISNFIATGRKVVLIGENNVWTAWNTQILSLVGGTYIGQTAGTASPVINNSLTAGVPSISIPTGGVASGGTPLFDINFATLWGSNVLTVLDVNVFTGANSVFEQNVANWIADSGSAPVPEPGTMALLGLGMGGLVLCRRRRNKK